MNIDRSLQRRILEQAKDFYPEMFDPEEVMRDDFNTPDFAGSLFYLFEHGLITNPGEFNFGDFLHKEIAITAKGLDFLEDDGGLSALLNTVTIRLHPDTIRQQLLARIANADGSSEEKSALSETVKTASDEALRTTTQKLVELGIQALPAAIQALRAVLPA